MGRKPLTSLISRLGAVKPDVKVIDIDVEYVKYIYSGKFYDCCDCLQWSLKGPKHVGILM
jgi:hypothetical protein